MNAHAPDVLEETSLPAHVDLLVSGLSLHSALSGIWSSWILVTWWWSEARGAGASRLSLPVDYLLWRHEGHQRPARARQRELELVKQHTAHSGSHQQPDKASACTATAGAGWARRSHRRKAANKRRPWRRRDRGCGLAGHRLDLFRLAKVVLRNTSFGGWRRIGGARR